jgi:hypothetical protein
MKADKGKGEVAVRRMEMFGLLFYRTAYIDVLVKAGGSLGGRAELSCGLVRLVAIHLFL